jgi:hypothetical protein
MRPPKVTPRFLPTLTEVVVRPPPPVLAPETGAQVDSDALVDRVMQSVGPRMELHLQSLVAAAMQEQVRLLTPLLHQELEAAVRDAVAQALEALQPHSTKAGDSPP